MAKYDTTKFYWLQLKEDFFDEDAIDWLEEQPNGKEYSLFYLKLCLKSLRSNGVLYRQVGNMIIPYDHMKLGELTKTNPDTVMVAMNLLLQIGLVEKLEDGKLYLTQVADMIGSQSKSAFKKQQQRLTRRNETPLIEGGQGVDICPPKIEKEIELEKELELEKDKELENLLPNGNVSARNQAEVISYEETAFNEFWSAYPKKVNKKGCYKSFCKIKNLKEEMPLILEALERFKASKGWQKDNGQFIPHPTTWINQERWKDEVIETREDKLKTIDMEGWV
jgi:predicted phage replisome organizer